MDLQSWTVPHVDFCSQPCVLLSGDHISGSLLSATGILENRSASRVSVRILDTLSCGENAACWAPNSFTDVAELRHGRVRNVRDYGMFERREEAQYFSDVERAARG
jgi:hypothetical protein